MILRAAGAGSALLLAAQLSMMACQGAPSEPDETLLREATRLRSVALADMEDGEYASAAEGLEKLAAILPSA